jgi:predicted dinucleotide-binding enzyme
VAVGIIGSGRIGATVARLLVAAGYEVGIANSRGPESLGELVAELGERARALTVAEAGSVGELVLVAIPLHAIDQLPGDAFAGKIVIDANNYYPGRDGTIAELDDDRTTSSELLAAQLPGGHVVKAFNTLNFATLGSEGRPHTPLDQRLAIPLAGDDIDPKERVAELIEQLGFAPLDTGSLTEGGRLQQPGALFFNRPLALSEATQALSARRG